MLVSVNMVFALFRQFFLTIKYDLVDLAKYPYLGPIAASLSQKFPRSVNFMVTVRSSAKATSLI